MGDDYGGIKGDTRSLDYNFYGSDFLVQAL